MEFLLFPDILDKLQFLHFANQGDHNLGNHIPIGMILLGSDSSADNGLGLHSSDFGIGDSQTAAAVAHHGVELVKAGDDGLDVL